MHLSDSPSIGRAEPRIPRPKQEPFTDAASHATVGWASEAMTTPAQTHQFDPAPLLMVSSPKLLPTSSTSARLKATRDVANRHARGQDTADDVRARVSCCRSDAALRRPDPTPCSHHTPAKRTSLEALVGGLAVEVKGIAKIRLDLCLVSDLATGGNRGARGSAGEDDNVILVVLGMPAGGPKPRLDIAPGTVVQRLLLAEDQVGVGVLVERLNDRLVVKRRKLLDPADRHVLDVVLAPVVEQRKVGLSKRQDVTLDLIRCNQLILALVGMRLGNEPLEAGTGEEVLQVGPGLGVTQETLGEEVDERLAELAVDLPPEHVEVVGRRGAVDDGHVAVLVLPVALLGRREAEGVVVAELEEPLDPRRRVLGTLTVVAVGQVEHETGALEPLALARGDELVDDALGVVGKVAELSLPDGKVLGRDEREAELEAHAAELGERRVADHKRRLALADVLERGIGALVLLVVEHRVPLGEGAALDILAGETDVVALERERTKGERLTGAHVDVLALVHGLETRLEDTAEVAVDGEVLRVAGDGLADVLERFLLDTGVLVVEDLLAELLGRGEALPGAREPLALLGAVVFALVKGLLEHAPDPLLVLLDVGLCEAALLDEAGGVLCEGGVLLCDGGVHAWLGEGGLVGLVVTVSAVADEVDDDVLLEGGAPVCGELGDEGDGLDVVAVDVEDGGVDGFGNVRGVGGGAGEARVGGEADLVVDDDVDGAAGGVVREVVHAHGLVHDTLTGKGGVAVHEERHGGLVLRVLGKVLEGTRLAEHDGVLCLEMGGVGDEGEGDLLARGGGADVVGAEVVLYVTAALAVVLLAGELVEDALDGPADDVCEDVETAAVGHADGDTLYAVLDGAVDERLDTGDERLAALEAEALLVGVLGGDEALERVGPDQAVEDGALLLDRVLEGFGGLDALAEPVALFAVGDVDVLYADGAAVHALAGVDDLADGELLDARVDKVGKEAGAEAHLAVEIGLAPSVVLDLEFLGDVGVEVGVEDAEGVEAGDAVTAHLVGTDEELELCVCVC
ncbi:hypothetical protein L1887_42337 [Cichorium endivia]|nr:hypothetical protein L1887_42337 [Cichorium endivia]